MNYSELAPIVAVDAMGCPQPVIVRRLAEAAQEFFRLTRAYKVDLDPATVPANTQSVALPVPAFTDLVSVDGVRYGSRKLVPKVYAGMVGEWETLTGTPEFYLVVGNSLRLVPYPDQLYPYILRARYTLAPTATAQSISDDPGLKFQDALIHGAKARLLAQPKKPWTDLQQAALSQGLFMQRVNEERIRVRMEGSSEAQFRIRSDFV